MPDMDASKNIPSPWGELTFEAVRAPLSEKHENECAEGASTAAPSRCANGKARAKRAAQFMPFAALTGYSTSSASKNGRRKNVSKRPPARVLTHDTGENKAKRKIEAHQ